MSARVVDLELTSKRREEGITKVVPFFVLLKNLHHQVSLGGESLDRTDKQATSWASPLFHEVACLSRASAKREPTFWLTVWDIFYILIEWINHTLIINRRKYEY